MQFWQAPFNEVLHKKLIRVNSLNYITHQNENPTQKFYKQETKTLIRRDAATSETKRHLRIFRWTF